MPRQYSSSVRRQIVARLRSGEPVAAVAAETGICQATLFRWKRQALIDAGVIEGTPSVEADELATAHKRIAQLEAELALTWDACELFDGRAVVSTTACVRSASTAITGTPCLRPAWSSVTLSNEHNHQHRHSVLGYRTPAEYAAACRHTHTPVACQIN
jgi:transposase-like protein